MNELVNLRAKYAAQIEARLEENGRLLQLPHELREAVLRRYYVNRLKDVENPAAVVFRMVNDFGNTLSILEQSKTVIFSTRQAEVFADLTSSYTDALEYRLPFQNVFLQFDQPFRTKYPVQRNTGLSQELAGLALRQLAMSRKEMEEEIAVDQAAFEAFDIGGDISFQPFMPDAEDRLIQNVLGIVFTDGMVIRFAWQSGTENEKFLYDDDRFPYYRNLAVACIGYINCENVYLHRDGEVSPAVNRKREAKGKALLEPYYLCRIRGVQYDGEGHKGTGVEHGYRYDVRGHFRRLDTGKVTWVRPHQRGLKHELYIPKTYFVQKGPVSHESDAV